VEVHRCSAGMHFFLPSDRRVPGSDAFFRVQIGIHGEIYSLTHQTSALFLSSLSLVAWNAPYSWKDNPQKAVISSIFSSNNNHLVNLPGLFIKYADTVFLHFLRMSDYFMSASFPLRASRSHRIYFVTAHSRWTTTASCAVPRISGNLDS